MFSVDLSPAGISAAKKVPNFWNNIHFHPTDAIEDDWGWSILDEVAADHAAKTVRMYSMFEDIVSRGADGKLNYDFTLNDIRMDYMVSKGFDLFISYNFMPACMASDDSVRSAQAKNKTRYKGKLIITSPPKDYGEWEEVCRVYTQHLVERYGMERVSHWYMQCWNEPDIPAFFISDQPDDAAGVALRLSAYLELYRAFAHGVKGVSENLRIGQSHACRNNFLDGFLKAVKEEHLPIDYISLHGYGTSVWDLHREPKKRFCIRNNIQLIEDRIAICDRYYPELPIINDEWGAASQGFYNREECPEFMFREGSEYAAYFCKMVAGYIERGTKLSKMMICLSGQHAMVVAFSGIRNFFTMNHIRKPIYNAYVLMGKLFETVVHCGEDGNMTRIVTVSEDRTKAAATLAYAPEYFDETLPVREESIRFAGVTGRKTVTIWLIDDTHQNPYRYALRQGYGDGLYNDNQIKELRAEGVLKPFEQYEQDFDKNEIVAVKLDNNALCLIEIG
ncbi:MAG: hypothetical protein MJ175_03715 [Clostridia bacterium]|nr:hypothetical protein [Clostridia bacterium]